MSRLHDTHAVAPDVAEKHARTAVTGGGTVVATSVVKTLLELLDEARDRTREARDDLARAQIALRTATGAHRRPARGDFCVIPLCRCPAAT